MTSKDKEEMDQIYEQTTKWLEELRAKTRLSAELSRSTSVAAEETLNLLYFFKDVADRELCTQSPVMLDIRIGYRVEEDKIKEIEIRGLALPLGLVLEMLDPAVKSLCKSLERVKDIGDKLQDLFYSTLNGTLHNFRQRGPMN